MKVIAFYLPQFHCIPENDKWWGRGFTEWVNVKKARPLFENHYQPRIPLNDNYYNLLNDKVMEWQANIAKEHGVTGFCFYHYWFNGKMLLEKPVENFLQNTDIEIDFCISWANEPWTNAWVSSNNKMLMEQKYGGKKEWEDHFNYLLPFFKDKRYIKENNKPLFVIYRPDIMDCYKEMIEYWNQLAKENGFDGLKFAYQHPLFSYENNKDKSCFDYQIEYQPITAIYWQQNGKKYAIKSKIHSLLLKYLKINVVRKKKLQLFNYDERWKSIINHHPKERQIPLSIPGAFVDWDNTPRRGETGSLYQGAHPKKFKEYFKSQVQNCIDNYHQDKLFIFAWNEWAEGGYLEPDKRYKYGYLEAIREVLEELGELE